MAENHYCPRCSAQFSGETIFCRKCGLALGGVKEILNSEAGNKPEYVTRPNMNAFRFGIGLFIFGLVLGLVFGVLKDFELFPARYGKAVFLGMIAAGMLCFGYAVAFPTKKYKKPKRNESTPDGPVDQLSTAPLAAELPAIFQNENVLVPKSIADPVREPLSVTEGTTRHLRSDDLAN